MGDLLAHIKDSSVLTSFLSEHSKALIVLTSDSSTSSMYLKINSGCLCVFVLLLLLLLFCCLFNCIIQQKEVEVFYFLLCISNPVANFLLFFLQHILFPLLRCA